MVTKNVYEELADMLVSSPTGAPEIKTPEFMQHLRLQYTHKEALLAVQVGLMGGKLEELAERTGVEKGKLKEILNTMADKATMWIDPGKEDPIYRSLGLVGPGITEVTLFPGVRNADSVTLAKLMCKNKYWHVRYGFGNSGLTNLAPVWPVDAALPEDALPSENIVEQIKQSGHWSVGTCPCRLGEWLENPGHHCRHLLNTCIQLGDISRWCVEHGLTRSLTCDQAIELLRKCNMDGLVMTGYPDITICNCCRDCCGLFTGDYKFGLKLLKRSNFVSQIDEETCSACKVCAGRCPVSAIEVDDFAVVDKGLCIGCGVCVPTCKTESVKLVRRLE
jgi:NAD-dependent dihydropyrimidine dehydrogenase PreA subunit